MKKALIVFLTLALLCMPLLAGADVGFVTLVNTLVQEDFLGEPDYAGYAPEDYALDVVLIMVSLDEGTFSIVGKTEDGLYAGCYWENREAGQLMSLLYAVCRNYEALSADCDNGLVVAFKTTVDTEYSYVSDAESATYLCEIIDEALSSELPAETAAE